jgi:hypothetical protein
MYSGTTFSRNSGKFVGVHQKIDRAARRHLDEIISDSVKFPAIKEILQFDGKNGPDAFKYMGPSQDKPWHFIDPSNPDDRALIGMINNHMFNLSRALDNDNGIRAAFEAAWLAHAIVDGLTPAHHYPLSGKVEELWGRPRSEFTNLRDKNIIRGANKRDTLAKNWEYWGMGGVITDHVMFEMGVASAIVPSRFTSIGLSGNDTIRLEREGFESLFMETLRRIYSMRMYDRFSREGWNLSLVKETRTVLVPEIIKVVTLAWYQSMVMS